MTTTPTRSTATPDQPRHRFRAAGPTAGLVELPDADAVTLTSPSEVDALLAEMEAARQKQLDALPSFNRDTVTAAYRATVEDILADIRAARARVAAGRYGICIRCGREIPVQRLQRRPWASMCTPCAEREDS